MKLIINGNFKAKKVKIWEIFEKYMLYTSKESLEHVEFRFRMKKYDFLKKNHKFWISDFDPSGGPFGLEAKISLFFEFSKLSEFFLKNGLKGS